jgi:hypothetical protein
MTVEHFLVSLNPVPRSRVSQKLYFFAGTEERSSVKFVDDNSY